MFNDVVSAMKPKTFFRRIAPLLYSVLVLYRENFALIAYYLLDGIPKYASRIRSKVVPLREQVHAVLLLHIAGESFRAFSESPVCANAMYFLRAIHCDDMRQMLAAK